MLIASTVTPNGVFFYQLSEEVWCVFSSDRNSKINCVDILTLKKERVLVKSCETTEKQPGPSSGAREKESDQSSWHSWAFLLGAWDRMKQNNTDKNHVL